jgi:hypothetical protein
MEKFKVSFNTLTGREEIIYSYDELKGSDLQRYVDNLRSLAKEGAMSAVYNIPNYSAVTIEILAE